MTSMILGFLSNFVPDILGYFKDREANKHSLAVAKLEAAAAASARKDELEAMVKRSQLNLEEAAQQAEHEYSLAELADVQDARADVKPVGGFIDKLRASVRPVYTYAFFGLYMGIKVVVGLSAYTQGVEAPVVASLLWTALDAEIFGAITGFWFGGRVREKARSGYSRAL